MTYVHYIILEIKYNLQDLLSYTCNWKFSMKTAAICVEILIHYYAQNNLIHSSNADLYRLLRNKTLVQIFSCFRYGTKLGLNGWLEH